MAPRQVVVDGSNIATEGRSTPSLAQLDQAVREFLVEFPDAIVTVVVDASFAHRIAASELSTFEEAEAAGEVVSPPAGAIGRGDAFLLRIADKTGAMVLSNDSFQEFHGEHEWLFDKGRLIGGKPVPGVGWIFTPRTPVRGPKSREAVKEAKRQQKDDGDPRLAMPGLDLAAERARSMGKEKKSVDRAIAVATEEAVEPNGAKRRRRRKGGSPPAEAVNDPLTFITFIAAHPLGSEVLATVDSFASHGAFVEVGGARCYVPLSAMGSPTPKSAREVFAKGDEVRFVIQALDPQRRGVELALPAFANVAGAPTQETVEAEIAREAESTEGEAATVGGEAPPRRTGARPSRRPDVKKAGGSRPVAPSADDAAPARRTRASKVDRPKGAGAEGQDAAAAPDTARSRSRAASEEVLAQRRAARRARLADEASAARAPVEARAVGAPLADEAPTPVARRSRRPARVQDELAAAPGPAVVAAAPVSKAPTRKRGTRVPQESPAEPIPPVAKVAARKAPSKRAVVAEAAPPAEQPRSRRPRGVVPVAAIVTEKPLPRTRRATASAAAPAAPAPASPVAEPPSRRTRRAGAVPAIPAVAPPAPAAGKAPSRRTSRAPTPEPVAEPAPRRKAAASPPSTVTGASKRAGAKKGDKDAEGPATAPKKAASKKAASKSTLAVKSAPPPPAAPAPALAKKAASKRSGRLPAGAAGAAADPPAKKAAAVASRRSVAGAAVMASGPGGAKVKKAGSKAAAGPPQPAGRRGAPTPPAPTPAPPAPAAGVAKTTARKSPRSRQSS